MKFPHGLYIPELDTLMNEQNLPVTLELKHTHNNGPFPDGEQGAGGHQFASALPQSLAFSRAFLIQRTHPQQNTTKCHLLHLPLPPATKQMIINWSLLCFSGALERCSEHPKYQLSEFGNF